MNQLLSYIRASRLITKSFFHPLSGKELTLLERWKNRSTDNITIANDLKSLKGFQEWAEHYHSFDPEDSWKKIHQRISLKARIFKLCYQSLKYAAALLVFISFFFFYQHITRQQVTTNRFTDVMPGHPKALLVLGDGTMIDLERKDTVFNLGHLSLQISDNQIRYRHRERQLISLGHHTLITPHGGEYLLVLPEGTEIQLNAMSMVRYPADFSSFPRTVHLSGEVFFNVASSEGKPFVVETDKVQIEVLGTMFNVQAYMNDNLVKTSVNSGLVKVWSENNCVVVAPNQRANYNRKTNDLEIELVDADIYSAWTQGKFVFRDVRLEEIMNSLSRWYSFDVTYASMEVKDIMFSLSVNRYDDINDIFEILALTKKIQYQIRDDHATISSFN